MRRGFGLLQAIMIVLLLGGMLTLVLRYARISAQHTRDSFVREQAELYLHSVVERALLEISAFDRSGGQCWSGASYSAPNPGRGKSYTATVTAERYFLFNESCSNVNYTRIRSPESHGYVLLRVVVDATLDGEPAVRLVNRSLQRP